MKKEDNSFKSLNKGDDLKQYLQLPYLQSETIEAYFVKDAHKKTWTSNTFHAQFLSSQRSKKIYHAKFPADDRQPNI